MYEVRPISANTYFGGAYGDFVHTLPIPNNFKNFNIAYLEILNVVVAQTIWDQPWEIGECAYFCDNHAVVDT